METIHSFEKLDLKKKTAIAIGYFDGMHLGHRELICRMREYAQQQGLIPAILTFDMSALRAKGKGKKDLFTREYTIQQAESMGIEVFAEIPFETIKDMDPEEFCKKVLAEDAGLKADAVFCGNDFRFGRDRHGDIEFLRVCGEQFEYSVIVIDDVVLDGVVVSTSHIKEAVENGDISKANKMLGALYSVSGEVIHGNHLAQGMGFPTANILFPPNVIVPKKGVYLTETIVEGLKYRSITNVGTRPTLTDDKVSTAETHILDFDENIYGKEITILFHKFMRPEQRFSNVEELKQTVLLNIKQAREADLGKS